MARIAKLADQVAPECRCVQFTYYMDGTLTGQLSLMLDIRSNVPVCRCLWLSELTKLSTDWHGKWARTTDGFHCEFDYKYDGSGKGKHKWADIVPDGVGKTILAAPSL